MAARAAVAAGCVGEVQCLLAGECSPALQAPADSLPFAVGYTRTASMDNTTFVFGVRGCRVCGAHACSVLASRLAPRLS